jgi:hypothetical protein
VREIGNDLLRVFVHRPLLQRRRDQQSGTLRDPLQRHERGPWIATQGKSAINEAAAVMRHPRRVDDLRQPRDWKTADGPSLETEEIETLILIWIIGQGQQSHAATIPAKLQGRAKTAQGMGRHPGPLADLLTKAGQGRQSQRRRVGLIQAARLEARYRGRRLLQLNRQESRKLPPCLGDRASTPGEIVIMDDQRDQQDDISHASPIAGLLAKARVGRADQVVRTRDEKLFTSSRRMFASRERSLAVIKT